MIRDVAAKNWQHLGFSETIIAIDMNRFADGIAQIYTAAAAKSIVARRAMKCIFKCRTPPPPGPSGRPVSQGLKIVEGTK
jgi:hypothetical protein